MVKSSFQSNQSVRCSEYRGLFSRSLRQKSFFCQESMQAAMGWREDTNKGEIKKMREDNRTHILSLMDRQVGFPSFSFLLQILYTRFQKFVVFFLMWPSYNFLLYYFQFLDNLYLSCFPSKIFSLIVICIKIHCRFC